MPATSAGMTKSNACDRSNIVCIAESMNASCTWNAGVPLAAANLACRGTGQRIYELSEHDRLTRGALFPGRCSRGAVPEDFKWNRGDKDNAEETHDHDGVAGAVVWRGDCPGARSAKIVTARGNNGSAKNVTARGDNGEECRQESGDHRAEIRSAAGVEAQGHQRHGHQQREDWRCQ